MKFSVQDYVKATKDGRWAVPAYVGFNPQANGMEDAECVRRRNIDLKDSYYFIFAEMADAKNYIKGSLRLLESEARRAQGAGVDSLLAVTNDGKYGFDPVPEKPNDQGECPFDSLLADIIAKVEKSTSEREQSPVDHELYKKTKPLWIDEFVLKYEKTLRLNHPEYEFTAAGHAFGSFHYFSAVDRKKIPPLAVLGQYVEKFKFASKEAAWNYVVMQKSLHTGNNGYVLHPADALIKTKITENHGELGQAIEDHKKRYDDLWKEMHSDGYKPNDRDWNSPETNIGLVVSHYLSATFLKKAIEQSGRMVPLQKDLAFDGL